MKYNNVDSTKKHKNTQQVLSVCYGYGGLERGVSSVIPIKPAAYVEIEAFQAFNLVSAVEAGLVDAAPIWTDLKTFDAQPFRNKLHGIIGGYPCQGESLAGKRELWEDDRFLWPYIEGIMRTARPVWGFFENVSGHLSGSFPYVLDSLRNLGYQVECGIYSAEEAGAPHQRKRLFILAVDDTADRRLWEGQGTPSKERQQKPRTGGQLENGFKRSSLRKLDHPNSFRPEPINKIRPGRHGTELASEKLADSQMSERKPSINSRGRLTGSSNCNIEELAHPVSIRSRESLQRAESGQFNKNGTKWPAKRGQPQYDWEAPRTVKPGVGCTINGYNFRTELLRQYGNGVVAQIAEIAFKDLIKKHLNK